MSPRVVWMPGGIRTEIHLASEDTDGAFCLLVDHPPAGWSLPQHLHHGIAETIHIAEGEFEINVDGQYSRLLPGETLHVPADVVHASTNSGSAQGKRIVIFSPAGMENFFLEAGAPSARTSLDVRTVAACAVSHGWEFVAR